MVGDPPAQPEVSVFLLLLTLASAAFAEDAWLTEAADLSRWPAATAPNAVLAKVEAGTRLQVVFREGDEVRVRQGANFGWVPAALLSDTDPAASDEPYQLPFGEE